MSQWTIPSSGPVYFSNIAFMLGISTYNMNSFRAPIGTYTPGSDISGASQTTLNIDIFHSKTRLGCPRWSTRMGSIGANDAGNALEIDSSNNYIVAGHYNGATCFFYDAPGTTSTGSLAQIGSYDTFIAKYNYNGILQWAARAGGTGQDFAYTLGMTPNGNEIYVSGAINPGSPLMNIYDPSGTLWGTINNVSSNSYSSFIIKRNGSGSTLWVARMGSTGNRDTTIYRSVVSADGSLYVGGRFGNTFSIYNGGASGGGTFWGAMNVISTVGYDVFLVKYNSTGAVQWAAKGGGVGSETLQTSRLASDSTNAVYLQVAYSNAYSVYNGGGSNAQTLWGTINPVSTPADQCLIKYNSAGAVQWAVRWGSPSAEQASSTVCDTTDNSVYATGSGTDFIQVYNSSGALAATIAGGGFVFKFDANGNFLWNVRVGGGAVSNVAITSNRDIVGSGWLPASGGTFYNASNVLCNTVGASTFGPAFIACWDRNGSFLWVTTSTGNTAGVLLNTVAANDRRVGGCITTSNTPQNFLTPSGVTQSTQNLIPGGTGIDVFLVSYLF